MFPSVTRSKRGLFSRIRGINRRWVWAGVLLTAAGAPMAITSSEDVQSLVNDSWRSVTAGSSEVGDSDNIATQFPARPASPIERPIEGPPTSDLGEVLRFDVTSAWIMNRWPRVSTGLSDVDLQGYRVPLVTGTSEHDLAGALTYYFGRHQRVERITFRGTTGDARPLVAVMARRHGFLRRAASDPAVHLYAPRIGEATAGQLRIRPARIVRSNRSHNRFEVELEMTRTIGIR